MASRYLNAPPLPPPPQSILPRTIPAFYRHSINITNIDPSTGMDEDACREKLTCYEVHTIRKAAPINATEKSTWARAEIVREVESQDRIIEKIRRLNESSRLSVVEKKINLTPFAQRQITQLFDELTKFDQDTDFEWLLAQLDSTEAFNRKKMQKETVTITVYAKRAPVREISAFSLYRASLEPKVHAMRQRSPHPSSFGLVAYPSRSVPKGVHQTRPIGAVPQRYGEHVQP